jgi:lipopolysaccharide biosynthesis regulator YciM
VIDPAWLLVLLPLAAASGWYVAKRDALRKQTQAEFNLPSAYFKGLNFLLNEQPDKAIEVFIKVLEVDSETVEMHLTLGNLFRRRGEVERATRIHQNLIARPSLSKSQRIQALYELAQDYFKAGLFDRAESLFQELADIPAHAESALRYLSQLYEQEKEWNKAVSVLRRSEQLLGKDNSSVIAQYYCEMAELALSDENTVSAHEYIQQALDEDNQCTRAIILLGEVQYRDADYRAAVKTWRTIEQQDPQFLSEIVDKLLDAYRRLDDDQGLENFLDESLDNIRSPKLLVAKVKELRGKHGDDYAEDFLINWLSENPSITGFRYLMELRKADKDKMTDRDRILDEVLANTIDNNTGYVCQQCGFSGRSMHWHCPGCKGWTTIKPIDDARSIAR